MSKKLFPVLSILLALAMITAASAQGPVTYDDAAYTSYQVVNLGSNPTTISVTYYDENGVAAGFKPTFSSVAPGGSVTVQQALETGLPSGRYSAVISAGEPIAAIGNQQLGVANSGASIAPFSPYTGAEAGATSVTLPAVMHNWFGYYTEIFIQNAGDAQATNIQISYNPTAIGSCTTGKVGTDTAASTTKPLPQYATVSVSQLQKTAIGAASATGCTAYTGRFLGAATITADKPIVVVVNQYVQGKLFTYNGFTGSGTTLLAPAYMKNYYGYYASLTIANPSTSAAATVDVTYTSDASFSNPKSTTVKATHTIPAGKSITLYDGPGASNDQSDLNGLFGTADKKFFGTVLIESTGTTPVPVVALINQESTIAGGNQAGSYNALVASEGTCKISVPLIQSSFYGYYTSLTIMTTDGKDATLTITYTSDGTFSSQKNVTHAYPVATVGGFLNRYEGPSASPAQSDILDDTATWSSGGSLKFIGSATIEVPADKCAAGTKIVAFVNSESTTAKNAATMDSLYSYNAFNLK